MTRAEKVISALGYAGLTPFVAACGLLYAGEEAGLFALVTSNVFALLAWSALLLSHGNILYPFIILTTGFVLLFLVEAASMPTIDHAVHRRYSAFRAFLTIAVLLLHGVFLLLSD